MTPFENVESDFKNFVSKLIFSMIFFCRLDFSVPDSPNRVSLCWGSRGFGGVLLDIFVKSSYIGAQKELEGVPGHL